MLRGLAAPVCLPALFIREDDCMSAGVAEEPKTAIDR
jgi:hypothetical protein